MPPTNRRRTTNKMRNASGMQLVEMVVALGLSGVFIVLLSQMMSENMRLGTATATDQMATAALDSLEENMLNMPYAQVAASPATEQFPIIFGDANDQLTVSNSEIRKIPLQQDLTSSTVTWGGFNPFTKQIDITNAWRKGSGPYFRGTMLKSIEFQDLNGINSRKVTITLKYSDANPNVQGVRTRTRDFYVIDTDSSVSSGPQGSQ